VSDYTAQIETPRPHTATCASREKQSFCVTVVGYKPKPVKWHRKKHGKRTEDVEGGIMKQQVDVFFGLFSTAHKPTAEHYNMQREDAGHYLKC
jgi:hypothetical protein